VKYNARAFDEKAKGVKTRGLYQVIIRHFPLFIKWQYVIFALFQ